MWVQYCHNCVIYTVYSNSKFQNRGTNTYIHIHILKSEENINFYVNYAYCWPLAQARFTARSSSLICLKLRTVVTYTWHGDTCGEGVAPAIVDMTGTQVAADWPVTRVAGGTGTTPPRPLYTENKNSVTHIEEGFIQKRRQRSSLLLGGQNGLNCWPIWQPGRFEEYCRMKSRMKSSCSGRIDSI